MALMCKLGFHKMRPYVDHTFDKEGMIYKLGIMKCRNCPKLKFWYDIEEKEE